VVTRYCLFLEQAHFSASTINLQLTAVRRLASEAADSGLLSPELASGIRRRTIREMQTQSADQIRRRLSGIADIYNRLVLLVGPPGSGKTRSLRALADAEKVPVLNVGSEIARRLLDLTERQ
jgi:hypothetical protein